jgi:hypothetical protein
MKQVKNSDDARTAYKKRQTNIAEYIRRIQQKLAEDPRQENINWDHVGRSGMSKSCSSRSMSFWVKHPASQTKE